MDLCNFWWQKLRKTIRKAFSRGLKPLRRKRAGRAMASPKREKET